MYNIKTPARKQSTDHGRGSFSTSMKSRFTSTAKKAKDTSLEKATIRVIARLNNTDNIHGADNTDNIQKLISFCDSKGIEVFEDESNSAIFEGNRYYVILSMLLLSNIYLIQTLSINRPPQKAAVHSSLLDTQVAIVLLLITMITY